VGFEPTDALRASRFSKPLPWASRAPLRIASTAPDVRGFHSTNWGGRIRTCDPRINSPMLCQLSYAPMILLARASGAYCPSRARTWTFLIQSQACCQLHQGAVRGPFPVAGCMLHGRGVQAGDGARTRDPQLGKLMLYQLSYSRGFHHGSAARAAGKDNTLQPFSPEPPVGFEPTTARLRIECSTPELRWRSAGDRSFLMEPRGIEPLTSAVRLQRSPI
jgi:hypothetical protein